MTTLKTRPDNLDFQIATSGTENYFKEAVVLVQSIINNNQWANRIKFHIFQDNLSPEQFRVFQSFEEKYPKVEVAFIDLKTVIKDEYDWHGSSLTHYQIDALTKISPISNWIISLEASEFCFGSFEAIIKELDPENLAYFFEADGKILSPFDGKYLPFLRGCIFIMNYDFFIKNNIFEKFLKCIASLQNYYPFLKVFRCNEFINPVFFSSYPYGRIDFVALDSLSFDEIKDNQIIIKWGSVQLSPWKISFPNNSLKKLYLETANQNYYTKNFQVPDSVVPSQPKVSIGHLLLKSSQYVARPFLHAIGKISPKLYRSIYRKLQKLNSIS